MSRPAKPSIHALAREIENARDRLLDHFAYDHPISGPFTMRQGMEFIRFHMERHLGHMREAGAS